MAKDGEVAITEDNPLTEREIAIARGEDPDATEDTDNARDAQVATDGDGAKDGPEPEIKDDGSAEPSGGTDAPSSGSWIDDDVKEMAAACGFSESELAGFQSADEFRGAMTLKEKNLLAPPPDKTPEKKEEEPQDEELDPKKYQEQGYDEETVKLVKVANAERARRKKLEETLKEHTAALDRITKAQHEAAYREKVYAFHEGMDALEPELFGRSVDDDGKVVKLSPEHEENRKKTWEWMDKLAAGILADAQRRGVAPVFPSAKALAKWAADRAVGEKIRAVENKKRVERLKEQAMKRRPVGSSTKGKIQRSKPLNPRDPDFAAQIANDPEVIKLWKHFQEQNGAE